MSVERRQDASSRGRISAIEHGYRLWTRRTIAVLIVLTVCELGLGVLSVSLLSRTGKADRNARRIDAAVCAEVHYLERGEQLTALDPKQSIVHNELKILLHDLRPLVPRCAPATPFDPAGPVPGPWSNP